MIINPAVWEQPDMRAALAAHDIGEVYRALKRIGVSQRQIGALVGQSQSEVSEILNGRVVKEYGVLERIAEGLGIPWELVGLSWRGADGTYCGVVTVAELLKGVSAEMLRRHLLALGATAAFGAPVEGLGELLMGLGTPAPAPLPSRLFGVHVMQVRELTRSVRTAIHARGSQPQVSSAAAAQTDQLLNVPGAEPVKQALIAALAELHNVAGWAELDAGLYDRAMHHYARALELATEAGDAYQQAVALACAGATMVEHGHLDDGLKMRQLGQVTSWDIPRTTTCARSWKRACRRRPRSSWLAWGKRRLRVPS